MHENVLDGSKLHMSFRVGIIGFGRLGQALAVYFAGRGHTCSTYTRHAAQCNDYRLNPITFLESNTAVAKEANVIVLAVKPKDFASVSEEIRGYVSEDTLILSCMAVVSIAKITETLGTALVVRCMPSIGIAHVDKMIPFYSHVDHAMFAYDLFGNNYLRLKSEEELDMATIIGACSPAIFAYIAMCFEELAKERSTMSEADAIVLIGHAMNTASHEMMVNGSQEVIRKVASPNGLTEGIIRKLMSEEIRDGICEALDTAITQIENSK